MAAAFWGAVDTTGAVWSKADITIPLPIGGAVEISAYTADDNTAVWRTMMEALIADPLASLDKPKGESGVKRTALA